MHLQRHYIHRVQRQVQQEWGHFEEITLAKFSDIFNPIDVRQLEKITLCEIKDIYKPIWYIM